MIFKIISIDKQIFKPLNYKPSILDYENIFDIGELIIYENDNITPIHINHLKNNYFIEFVFKGEKSIINRNNNYGIKDIIIEYPIFKREENYMNYIMIKTNHNIYYYLFTPNILHYYYNYTINNDSKDLINKIYNDLEKINPKLKNIKIKEGISSFTKNKDIIYLCLRDKYGDYYSYNVIFNVILHEISHLLQIDENGHTDKFWELYDFLLQKAIDYNICDKISKQEFINYCI